MDRRAWWEKVYVIAKNQTQLKQLNSHACVSLAAGGIQK